MVSAGLKSVDRYSKCFLQTFIISLIFVFMVMSFSVCMLRVWQLCATFQLSIRNVSELYFDRWFSDALACSQIKS